jgi:hypothetical protein
MPEIVAVSEWYRSVFRPTRLENAFPIAGLAN